MATSHTESTNGGHSNAPPSSRTRVQHTHTDTSTVAHTLSVTHRHSQTHVPRKPGFKSFTNKQKKKESKKICAPAHCHFPVTIPVESFQLVLVNIPVSCTR